MKQTIIILSLLILSIGMVDALCMPYAIAGQVKYSDGRNADGAIVTMTVTRTGDILTDIVGINGNAQYPGWYALDGGNTAHCTMLGDEIEIVAKVGKASGFTTIYQDNNGGRIVPTLIIPLAEPAKKIPAKKIIKRR